MPNFGIALKSVSGFYNALIMSLDFGEHTQKKPLSPSPNIPTTTSKTSSQKKTEFCVASNRRYESDESAWSLSKKQMLITTQIDDNALNPVVPATYLAA
jgi:hypothetical protein